MTTADKLALLRAAADPDTFRVRAADMGAAFLSEWPFLAADDGTPCVNFTVRLDGAWCQFSDRARTTGGSPYRYALAHFVEAQEDA